MEFYASSRKEKITFRLILAAHLAQIEEYKGEEIEEIFTPPS